MAEPRPAGSGVLVCDSWLPATIFPAALWYRSVHRGSPGGRYAPGMGWRRPCKGT